MAEYIEREVTCKDCIHYDICIFHHKGNENKKCVRFKNKADVVEVRHAYWIRYPELDDIYYAYCHCSNCGFMANRKHDYCVCGAKMDGKGEGEC